MKYAIRLSRLPPAVIYADIELEPEAVVAILAANSNGVGVCGLVHKTLQWLAEDIFCDRFELVEDEGKIVFTDPKDAEVLITRTDKGFDVSHLTDDYNRNLLGR
jgi:hypothetical protein